MIRVFPRRTNASPDDEDARFDEPGLFDLDTDEVIVSVTWTWDKNRGEYLAEAWRSRSSSVKIGGPAYDDPGGEFIPGMFVKKGYVMTSRGCPNFCWFCSVPKREGNIREIEIKDGWNVLDSNLLACSDDHIKKVFDMLKRQKEKPRFTGGLEAKRMKPWIAQELKLVHPHTAYFAYDTADDYEPLVEACKMLREVGEIQDKRKAYSCYVLVGYRGDTFEKAEKRLQQVIDLGITPMSMLYNNREGFQDQKEWKKFHRLHARRWIVESNKETNSDNNDSPVLVS